MTTKTKKTTKKKLSKPECSAKGYLLKTSSDSGVRSRAGSGLNRCKVKRKSKTKKK